MNNESVNVDEESGIVYKKWQCCSPKAVFLLVHGLGAYSGRWDQAAQFFLKHDISSYAIDLKGFGQAEGVRGHINSFQTYFQDIQTLCEIIKKENSDKKVFLVGESMGGLIAFVLVAFFACLFDGLICISPAFKSKLKFSRWDYIRIFFFLIVNSKKQFMLPFDAIMCTQDSDCRRAVENNEIEHRLATSRLLFNIFLAQKRACTVKDEIDIPVLFLVAGEDEIVDSKVAEDVFGRFVSKDKRIISYSGMRHALTIEIERQKVFEDILRWIKERV
ncbi:MAG: lysophospholipase [Candidatus Omnitrophota bacterium]